LNIILDKKPAPSSKRKLSESDDEAAESNDDVSLHACSYLEPCNIQDYFSRFSVFQRSWIL